MTDVAAKTVAWVTGCAQNDAPARYTPAATGLYLPFTVTAHKSTGLFGFITQLLQAK